jgi:hypothetical protein
VIGARAVGLICVLAVVGAACGSIPSPEVRTPEGRQFIPMVPDSIDDVGRAPSVAVDAQGLPSISYFGFVAQLAEGEIPVARPVGSPFLTTEDGDGAGAVLLASLTPEQIWTRGAIAQPRDTPSGVPVPFEPAAEPSLATLTPARAAGTDLAIAGADVHAAWATDTGVYYGLGPSPFEIGLVEGSRGAGAPSVAVDDTGEPIVAYTLAATQPEVRVAERAGDGWRVTSVATLSRCGVDCPPATQIAFVGGEPPVVVTDPLSGEIVAARSHGTTWETEVVATGATGGASLAVTGDTAAVAFYTPAGVAVATGRFGSWSVEDVGAFAATEGEQTVTGDAAIAPGTSVAVDGKGTTWVAWQDPAGIHLASRTDGAFDEVELPDTSSGVNPSLAITEDGATVYLAWYDADEGDLRLGAYGEIADLLIAAPPPLPSVAPPSTASCGEDAEPVLEITAQGTAFDTNCLVAPAGEPFTLTFHNEDAGVTHNLEILTAADGEEITATDLKPGTYTDELPVDAQEQGDLYFLCQAHPTQMFGTLAVVGGGGGGGGSGGGG